MTEAPDVNRGRSVRELIELAIALAGSEKKLGELCGYTQPAIWRAKKAGRVSGELAIAIDLATNGEVSKLDLRPDLWPRRLPPDKRIEHPKEG